MYGNCLVKNVKDAINENDYESLKNIKINRFESLINCVHNRKINGKMDSLLKSVKHSKKSYVKLSSKLSTK